MGKAYTVDYAFSEWKRFTYFKHATISVHVCKQFVIISIIMKEFLEGHVLYLSFCEWIWFLSSAACGGASSLESAVAVVYFNGTD